MTDRGHGIHQIIFKGKTIEFINEMAVYLDIIRLNYGEHLQPAIPHSEIVNGNLVATLPVMIYRALEKIIVLDGLLLGDFQNNLVFGDTAFFGQTIGDPSPVI